MKAGYALAFAVGAMVLGLLGLASTAQAAVETDCTATAEVCAGKAYAATDSLLGTRHFCLQIEDTTGTGSCSLDGDAPTWELTSGQNLTLEYITRTSGTAPPNAPDNVRLEARFSDQSDVICTFNTSGTVSSGTTYKLHATNDCTETGTPSSGTLRLFLEVDFDGVTGDYDVNSDGTGPLGQEEYQRGSIRSWMNPQAMDLSHAGAPMGLYAYGTGGDESVTITATYPRPFLSDSVQDVRIDAYDGGVIQHSGSNKDAETDGNTTQAFVIDDDFDADEKTYAVRFTVTGNDPLTDVQWTRLNDTLGTLDVLSVKDWVFGANDVTRYWLGTDTAIGSCSSPYNHTADVAYSTGIGENHIFVNSTTVHIFNSETCAAVDKWNHTIDGSPTPAWDGSHLYLYGGGLGAIEQWTLAGAFVANHTSQCTHLGFVFADTSFWCDQEAPALGQDFNLTRLDGNWNYTDDTFNHDDTSGDGCKTLKRSVNYWQGGFWMEPVNTGKDYCLFDSDGNILQRVVNFRGRSSAIIPSNINNITENYIIRTNGFTADPRVTLENESCQELLYNRGEATSCSYNVRNARQENVTRGVQSILKDSLGTTISTQSPTGALKQFNYTLTGTDNAAQDLTGTQWSLTIDPTDTYAITAWNNFRVSSKLLISSDPITAMCQDDGAINNDDGFGVINRLENHTFSYHLGYARCEPYASQTSITQEIRRSTVPATIEDTQLETSDGNGRINGSYTPAIGDAATTDTLGDQKILRVTHNGNMADDSQDAWGVSDLYLCDAHAQLEDPLIKDPITDKNRNEDLSFIISADILHGWGHITNVRGDIEIDTPSSTVELRVLDPNGDEQQANLNRQTGADGWVMNEIHFAAAAPAGTWQLTLDHTSDGNTCSDSQNVQFTSAFTADKTLRLHFNETTTGGPIQIWLHVENQDLDFTPAEAPVLKVSRVNTTTTPYTWEDVLPETPYLNVINWTATANGSLYLYNWTPPSVGLYNVWSRAEIEGANIRETNNMLNVTNFNPAPSGIDQLSFQGLGFDGFLFFLIFVGTMALGMWKGYIGISIASFFAASETWLPSDPIPVIAWVWILLLLGIVEYGARAFGMERVKSVFTK